MSKDFLVVGAGIVGLTTAWELKKRYPTASITVLDKESRPGVHASGRNSGVLHSGIYYAADTLKAKVCAKGGALVRQFAKENDVRCETWGKVIIPTDEEDLPSVNRLMKNAQDSGIRAVKLDEAGIRVIEPHARVFRAGIHSPDTAVIDSRSVVNKLVDLLKSQGVGVYFNQEVLGVDSRARRVTTSQGRFDYGFFFNCAGAQADRIARRFGLCQEYALVPFKGIYYRLNPAKNHLVKSSIYPVPNLLLPFLGIHLTRLIDGNVYVGPTAIPAFGRENYGLIEGLKVGESLSILWQIAGMYARNQQNFRHLVHIELRKYLKSYFFQSASRLVDRLVMDDLLPCDKVGIRPQLIHIRLKKLEMDYIFENTQTSLHVLNAISPAFTSSFAFAQLIVDRFEEIQGGEKKVEPVFAGVDKSPGM